MAKEKIPSSFAFISILFRIQAFILIAFFGFHTIIPLAINPFASGVWIIIGVGILFIAKGVYKGKKWAPLASLLGTTLPYLLYTIIMQILQNKYGIWEGPKTGTIDLPLIVWIIVAINLACSTYLLSKRKYFNSSPFWTVQENNKKITPISFILNLTMLIIVISIISMFLFPFYGYFLLTIGYFLTIASLLICSILSGAIFLKLYLSGKRSHPLFKKALVLTIISITLFVISISFFLLSPISSSITD